MYVYDTTCWLFYRSLLSPKSPGCIPLLRADELMKKQCFKMEKMKWERGCFVFSPSPYAHLYGGTRPVSRRYTHSFLGCFLQNVLVPRFPQWYKRPMRIPQKSACIKDCHHVFCCDTNKITKNSTKDHFRCTLWSQVNDLSLEYS